MVVFEWLVWFWRARFEVFGIDRISESLCVVAKNIRGGAGVEEEQTQVSFDKIHA